MTRAGESSLHGGFAWGCIFFINMDKKQLPEKAAVFSFVLGQGRAVALLRLGVFSGAVLPDTYFFGRTVQ